MYRILVPLDGSARAERAIPWADELTSALNAEVDLISIVEPKVIPEIPLAEGVTLEAIDTGTFAARSTLEFETELFTRVRPTKLEVVLGAPSEGITSFAQAQQVDLIVMSSHGRGELGRAFLGSVADEVIRGSHVPVLVIRDGVSSPPDHLPRTILVPLDGSELSETVLTNIKPIALALGCKVILFWQVDLPPQTLLVQGDDVISSSAVSGVNRTNMVEYLERTAAGLNTEGIVTDVRVRFGHRAESIVDFAEKEGVDLIAMSTHGRHGFDRWLRGSVTDYVLTHATVPVFTVRPGAVAVRARIDDERMRPLDLTAYPVA